MSRAERDYERAVYTSSIKQGMTGIHSTLVNDNYVNKYESSISAVETVYSQSRWTVSLNAPTFGATSQAYLPSQSLIGETYLLLSLEMTAVDNTANFSLPQGWGLRAIQSLSYTMPSDSVGLITITNDEMYHYLMCQERDVASCTALFDHMGPCVPADPANPTTAPLNQPVRNGAVGAANWTATILLPLPWCSLGYDTKPMDSNIFGSGQIFLNITFANASQVYNKLAGAPGTQLRIKDAVLTYRQGEMTNQENSLKYMMMRDPSLVYDMPFIRSQIKSVGNLTPGAGISVSGGKGTASFFISGMLNADLVGMCITAHYIPDGALGYNTGNPYVIADLYNLRVTFAGLTLYYAQNYSNRLFNFQSADSAGYSASTIVRGAEAVDNYPHIINFSRLRSMHWDDHYFNVKKYSAQTFNIEFGVPDDCLTAGTGYLPGLDVRVTMFYNGTIELGQYRTQQRLL